jgi:hypothetical protein
MEWLISLAHGSFRRTGLIGLAGWIICFIALLVCMKHARMDSEGLAYAALVPEAERDSRARVAQQQATMSPTATITPSVTASSTISPTITPTLTVTGTTTLSPTQTASATWTPVLVSSPTPSASATSLAVVSATITPDLVETLLALSTEIFSSTLSVPGEALTQTATLIPFPKITLVVPTATSTDALNYLEAPPGASSLPKGSVSIWVKLGRFWPLAILLAFWLVLGVWFLVVRVLDRN